MGTRLGGTRFLARCGAAGLSRPFRTLIACLLVLAALALALAWVVFHGVVLTGCAEAPAQDAFGPTPGAQEKPAFMVPSDTLTLADLRRQILTALEPEAEGDKNRFAFLPYTLPEGFQPAAGWGANEGDDEANAAVSGDFYAVAFTDGSTVIRLAVDPDDAPSSLEWTLPRGRLGWDKTGAGALLHEVWEAVRDGIDHFRVELAGSDVVVYGPQDKRAQIWKVVEGLAPAVIGGAQAVPAIMPADFDFVARWGVGAKNVLDTAAGTFTQDMIADPSITIDLALTAMEKAELYQHLRDIDFWAYPADAGGLDGMGVTPSTDYSLTISGVGLDHTVRGNDFWTDPEIEAQALYKLFQHIQAIIEAKDEFKELPEPRGGYA